MYLRKKVVNAPLRTKIRVRNVVLRILKRFWEDVFVLSVMDVRFLNIKGINRVYFSIVERNCTLYFFYLRIRSRLDILDLHKDRSEFLYRYMRRCRLQVAKWLIWSYAFQFWTFFATVSFFLIFTYSCSLVLMAICLSSNGS